MKKFYLFFIVFTFNCCILFAQSSFTVGLNGGDSNTCFYKADALGVYNYDKDVNGKPRYIKGVVPTSCSSLLTETECSGRAGAAYFYLQWSGTEWQWVEINDNNSFCIWLIEECVPAAQTTIPVTSYATSFQNTILPSCNGWTATSGNTSCEPVISGCETLSLPSVFVNKFKIFPNPTKGNVFISLPKSNELLTVNLYNTIGQIVWTNNISNVSSFEVNMKGPAGLYIIEIVSNKGDKARYKLIKE